MKIFEKLYDGESMVDVYRDISECFDGRYNPKMNDIPVDEYNLCLGTFKVTVIWEAPKQISMYDTKLNCPKCRGAGHYYQDAGMGFSDHLRCECSRTPTKEYQELLDKRMDITPREFNILLEEFVDNYYMEDKIWDSGRSW